MTEQNLHDYNKWLTEVWSKQHSNIPFMIDAPKAFLKYQKEQLRIAIVGKRSELLKAFEIGDEVECWKHTLAKVKKVKLTGYICEDSTGFTFLVDNKDVRERSL